MDSEQSNTDRAYRFLTEFGHEIHTTVHCALLDRLDLLRDERRKCIERGWLEQSARWLERIQQTKAAQEALGWRI